MNKETPTKSHFTLVQTCLKKLLCNICICTNVTGIRIQVSSGVTPEIDLRILRIRKLRADFGIA